MSLEIIINSSEIISLNKAFHGLMKSNSTGKPKKLRYSTPGGSGEAIAYYYPNSDFWWSGDRLSKSHKFYNLFGIAPDYERTNSIRVQINYQKEFNDFKEAAYWAKDNSGRVFLLHSGKMGGGIKGITIENIDKYYSRKKVVASNNGNQKECFIVCEINSPRAFTQVVSFIKEIDRIKCLLTELKSLELAKGDTNNPFLMKKYTPEFWGKRSSYYRDGIVESVSDHGSIVDALKYELETNFGFKNKCTKNKYVDLGIDKNGKPIAIFEFKTSTNTQSVYTAIGQVLLHSNSLKSDPMRFVVFPNQIDIGIISDLKNLGIETLRYEWKKDKVHFLNLNILKNVR